MFTSLTTHDPAKLEIQNKMRIAEVKKKNKEIEIFVKTNLDADGKANVDTGFMFLNHLITSLATHSLIDITINIRRGSGWNNIEETALNLGRALREAINQKPQINCLGFAIVPMDCSLVFSSLDLANCSYVNVDLQLKGKKIEDTPSAGITNFLEVLGVSMQANMHIWTKYGCNDHHKAEAAFKALGLSLREAIKTETTGNCMRGD